MTTTVVTTFSHDGYHEYGKRFLETFAQFWPADIHLVVYVERPVPLPGPMEGRPIASITARRAFMARHADDPLANGNVATSCWREKEIAQGHSYRTNAVKFSNKVFALHDAAMRCSDDVLVWLDADVVTFERVPPDLVDRLLGAAAYAYLGRVEPHSECGFMAFRMPTCLRLINGIASLYETDRLFTLEQWHDSFVFDYVRSQMPGLIGNNLARPNDMGHVWNRSPLVKYMVHLKGPIRKQMGVERELWSMGAR